LWINGEVDDDDDDNDNGDVGGIYGGLRI